MNAIRYGDEVIPYLVVTRPARRTLGIEVYPDGRVLVLAPAGCGAQVVDERVRKRVRWISRQRAMFAAYPEKRPARQYVSGEAHRYLGRQYRLRVVVEKRLPRAQVRLTRGDIVVALPMRGTRGQARDALLQWYRARAQRVFGEVMDSQWPTFSRRGCPRPKVVLRRMQNRWGSMSMAGRMTLNVRLVRAPRACIEYVVAHELCHLVHRRHDARFFALLERVMPDWQRRKHRLEAALF